jgi:ABC-2 type transport system ATP-binding protein
VEEGELRAIVGPNGAGKTTLMRILTTQIKPTSGDAWVLGHHVVREAGKVRGAIGYVPQEFSVWNDLTGYENLLVYAKLYGIPRDRRKRVVEEMLEFMELKEAANRLVRNVLRRDDPTLGARDRSDGQAPRPLPRRADDRLGPES